MPSTLSEQSTTNKSSYPNIKSLQYDVVIIGSGAAGLSAAIGIVKSDSYKKLTENGKKPSVLVISKLQALRAHTGSAEGGIAASLSNIDQDYWQWHYYDTVHGGDWLSDQDAAKILAKEASKTVIQLEHYGVAFSRTNDGHIAQRNFGGHTSKFGQKPIRRAAYAADRIGHQILYSLWQQCVAENINFAEECYVTDIAINHESNRVEGIVAYNESNGNVLSISTKSLLIATGGAGRLFSTTSNSWDLTGDGMALALKAGLQLEDCEFIQFHPTGLSHTGILISEAARSEGGILRNSKNEAFMKNYDSIHSDLAPRDVVSRAIISEIDAGRGVEDTHSDNLSKDCVWLDMTNIQKDHMKEVLPQVLETIEKYGNYDPSHDFIPIKPTAHYTMGGIPISLNGEVYKWDGNQKSVIQGLYASGECSCVGVHGANRLGGNSLLEACLFGTKAGISIANSIKTSQIDSKNNLQNNTTDSLNDNSNNSLNDNTTNNYNSNNNTSDNSTDNYLQTNTQTNNELNNINFETENTENTHEINKSSNEILKNLTFKRANIIRHMLSETKDKTINNTVENTEQSAESNPYALFTQLGKVMEHAIAVRCSEKTILEALNSISEIEKSARELKPRDTSLIFNQEMTTIYELQNMITLSKAILYASLNRHESRGSFNRLDYPNHNSAILPQHSFIDNQNKIYNKPVNIIDFQPNIDATKIILQNIK